MFNTEIWMWNLTAKMIEYLVWGLDLLSMDKMKFSGSQANMNHIS